MTPRVMWGLTRCHEGEMEMEVKVFTLKELTFYWILPNTKMAYY